LTSCKTFKSKHEIALERNTRFIDFQSSVNFDRAALYYENLGRSEIDLVNSVGDKKQELASVTLKIEQVKNANNLIHDAELPNWRILQKAIHDLAFEIASQASATKEAHDQFASLEEGAFPVAAHPLYEALDSLVQNMRSPSLDESTALASRISEIQFKIQDFNLKANLDAFESSRKSYSTAVEDYTQKNKAFCEKSRLESGKRNITFNALELDEIERATPEHISALVALFERLNVCLEKDREDAQTAINAAQSANQEAISQLSSLIRVADDNLDALKKVMKKYPNGCFKIKVQLAGEELIKEILSELTIGIKSISANASDTSKITRRSSEGQIKDFLRGNTYRQGIFGAQCFFCASWYQSTRSSCD
jgi:hypothetical protein